MAIKISSLKSTLVVLLVFMLHISTAKVMVYSPKELRKAVEDKGKENGFDVSLANFGVIPYGHTVIGRIYYDDENKNGCKPFTEFDFSNDPDDDKHPTPIIIVERGN